MYKSLIKAVSLIVPLLFLSINSYSANAANWTAFSALYIATSGADLAITLTGNISVGANIGAPGRNNLTIAGNTALKYAFAGNKNSGFIIYNRNITFTGYMEFTNFYNSDTNTDHTRGGGVFRIINNSQVTFNISTMNATNNTAASHGGVMYIAGAQTTVTIKGVEIGFSNNSSLGSTDGGGAFRVTQGAALILSVEKIVFDNNIGTNGPSIYLHERANNIPVGTLFHVTSDTKELIVRNSQSSWGGA
ncbi:MAG: hypothetical protein LBT79_06000, partial [Elusimicrobiota bacterium]|nr:hypothetical protein [Elusimicrobiota bacterium]